MKAPAAPERAYARYLPFFLLGFGSPNWAGVGGLSRHRSLHTVSHLGKCVIRFTVRRPPACLGGSCTHPHTIPHRAGPCTIRA